MAACHSLTYKTQHMKKYRIIKDGKYFTISFEGQRYFTTMEGRAYVYELEMAEKVAKEFDAQIEEYNYVPMFS